MREPERKRRIGSRSMRAPEIETSQRRKDDIMVPGMSEIDCRVAEFRFHEMHAEAQRRRVAYAQVAPQQRSGVSQVVRVQGGVLLARLHSRLSRMASLATANTSTAPALGSGQ